MLDAASVERETRTWSMALHLSLFAGYLLPFAGFIAPIVIWQVKKDELPGVDAHGRNVMNWIISHAVYWGVSFLLLVLLIGIPMMTVLFVASVVFPIIGAIKAADGKTWSYPGSMPLL
jgi:uncharacterized Tic20 family protein